VGPISTAPGKKDNKWSDQETDDRNGAKTSKRVAGLLFATKDQT
jgi:hypothetical protein